MIPQLFGFLLFIGIIMLILWFVYEPFRTFFKTGDKLISFAENTLNGAIKGVSNAFSDTSNFFGNAVKGFSGAISDVGGVTEDIGKGVSSVTEDIGGAINDVGKVFSGIRF